MQRTCSWALGAAILLTCPSWSSGLLTAPSSVGFGPASAACRCLHRTQRRGVALVCKDASSEAESPQMSQTRAMNWAEENARGTTSRSMDEKKSLRIAQLRAELQEVVRMESYAEAAILQEQIQALERTAVREAFQTPESPPPTPRTSPQASALAIDDETLLSASRGPMQRRPSRALKKEPPAVLTDRERLREDDTNDALFYREARLVTHVDLKFALRLGELYEKRLLPGSAVLDLGAACVSYLPDGVVLREVVGLGMNMEEMEANDDLTKRVVHDLNALPQLPFEDNSFDAVICASAIQYFTQPEKVLAEASRVLRTGGILIISFTDRCLASKALVGWKERGNLERSELVADLVRSAPGLTTPEVVWEVNQLSAVGQMVPTFREQTGGDPFIAVVSYKGSPPPGWMMQVDQTGVMGPFKKLSPFAAMYMVYLLISHGMG